MDRRDCLRLGAAAIAAPFLNSSVSLAQSKYPQSTIRLIVPYAPGGVVDAVARHWADRMKPLLGTVIIENQGGGGGTIGAAAVSRATPDGYTLLFGDSSSQIIAPSLMANPPYDPAKNFSSIAMVATSSTAIVVHPSVPATTLAEFIDYAKGHQKQLSYASAGAGTVTHLAGELFKQLIKAPDITHVPYRGAGPGLSDLIAGTIPMMTPNVTGQVLSFHRTGKVRILAVCAPEPLKTAPDIPAATKTLPGLVVQLTCGVLGPAGLPQPIVAQISEATAQIIKDPEFGKVMESAGLEPRTDASPAAAEAYLVSERQRLVPVIRAAGMQPI
ncbi:MAG TPA: tripartite tricarboxylate transporter substrate binding protein [Pseudolabrys sp.]